MSEPALSMPGAVDLSALRSPMREQAVASPGVSTVEVTEANAAAIIQQSSTVPVIIAFWAEASPASVEVKNTFATVSQERGGAFVAASVDAHTHAAVAQAFQVQAVPAALALIGGQPAPLFQGNATPEQIADVVDQVLAAARQAGISGHAEAASDKEGDAAAQSSPLPPLHQQAFDAIESGNLEEAMRAYSQALKENPRDTDARAGLAQVRLMSRTQHMNAEEVRAAAAQSPDDVEAQLQVADLDVLGGKVEDAFARLMDVASSGTPEVRNTIRERLVELFDVVGGEDPRVVDARRALSAALF